MTSQNNKMIRTFILISVFFSFSWEKIAKKLGWSLLDLSKELDFFNSIDSFTATFSRLSYAAYLFVALILLINMLIALLSNTYQRVQASVPSEGYGGGAGIIISTHLFD